jgi:hypothetical protein
LKQLGVHGVCRHQLRLVEPRAFSNATPSSTAEFGVSCI